MPVGTIMIHGSQGEVMAPIRNGSFIAGKRRDIRVIASSKDPDLPPAVREAFVGLVLPTMFSSEQVNGADGKAPAGCRIAYVCEVAEALVAAGKSDLAQMLEASMDPDSKYNFIVFKKEEFEFVA